METPVLYMARPVGGRGKTAPKPTIMRRIPEGIKEAVEQLADLYREDQWDGNLENLISSSEETNKPDIKLNEECDQLLVINQKLDLENQDLLKKLQDTRVDRDELDQEVDRLSAKVGDLDLEKQNLADQLAQTQAELEKVQKDYYSPDDYQRLAEKVHELEEARSHQSVPTANELPEPAELLNQFRKKLPKSKISLREVEMLLELL